MHDLPTALRTATLGVKPLTRVIMDRWCHSVHLPQRLRRRLQIAARCHLRSGPLRCGGAAGGGALAARGRWRQRCAAGSSGFVLSGEPGMLPWVLC